MDEVTPLTSEEALDLEIFFLKGNMEENNNEEMENSCGIYYYLNNQIYKLSKNSKNNTVIDIIQIPCEDKKENESEKLKKHFILLQDGIFIF